MPGQGCQGRAGCRSRGRDAGAGPGARGSFPGRSGPGAPGPPGQSPCAMSGAPGGGRPTFPGLPGERVLEEAAGARQRCGNGGGSVPGTLLCTNRRLAFLPGQAPSSRGLLRSEDEVALPCIHKLVAASSFSKPKVLTAASTLKFIPEELAVFCRDFRLLRFSFPENGLAPQAFRVANAIAQAREEAAWLGDAADGWASPGEAPAPPEEDEDEEGSSTTLLFESLRDWEKELQRLGAAGWRVSAVNERFDMAPSLPQYLWVPSGLLDHDLKRTFAHFQERRVPRLCWHHPGGGDLLRAASFHPASEPGSEDVRCLEELLLGGRGPCVLADTAELPTLADIQLAHLRLRALCLPGAVAEEKWLSALEGTRWLDHVRSCLRKAAEVASLLAGRRCSVVLQEPSDRDLNCLLASLVQLLGDPHARSLPGFQSLVQREWVAAGHPFPHRLGLLGQDSPREEAPVFLLFLDCTWQLLWQFPADFGFTEAFLLALHDSSFSPSFSTFRFSCQRQRGHSGLLRLPSQTYRPMGGWQDPGGHRGDPRPCSFPPVWAWGRRYTRQQREQFRNPLGPPGPAESPSPGTPADPCPWGSPRLVLTLAKGSLSPHPLPWWSRPPLRPPLRVAPSDSQGTQGGLLGTRQPPPGLLLPCTAGPCIRLWHRCYLRGLPQEQRGRSAPSLAGLAEELRLLQERLGACNLRRPH
ncbi:myotubularin-related protein 11 isoform X2 [Onychostruthus taczanowskii]|uniref:myotubularin-related protein 11 isoform X2 n=1 Tax=Onychostruthus taczanowskii TaxID=356909 RepID=UPI001B803687|nr:myotubularin-related protein 11 isoform X2 [Onychostruthus taczanowskii]